jgi:hypothetical protein
VETLLKHGCLNYTGLDKEMEDQSVSSEVDLRIVFMKMIQGHWIRRISRKDHQSQSTRRDTDQTLLFPQPSSGKAKSIKNGAIAKDKGIVPSTQVQETFPGEPSKVRGKISLKSEDESYCGMYPETRL